MPIRGILMDVDDTLVDERENWLHSVNLIAQEIATGETFGRRVEPIEVSHAYSSVSDDLWRRYDVALRPLGSTKAIREYVWKAVLSQIGWSPPQSFIEGLVARFAALRLLGVARDGDLTELLRLVGSRYKLAICSNGRESDQREKLERRGIEWAFQHYVCGRDLGLQKPAPGIFLEACKRFNLDPSECLHVGDDWQLDVVGARNAGLSAIWISMDEKDGCSGGRFSTVHAALQSLIDRPR